MKDTTQPTYRDCFNTQSGQRTLGMILIDAGYFDTNLESLEQLAVLNFVKRILKKCGLNDEKYPNQVESYVQKLFEIPIRSQ